MRTFLIVDDEPAIRTYLKYVLEGERVQIIEAANAVEALRLLHKLGGDVDLLLTDIQMPGDINGLDLAHSAQNSFPHLPIVLISGYSDKESGGFAFIQKPFTPEAILGVILDVMGKQCPPDSSAAPL